MAQPMLAAYDRNNVYELLRETTAHGLAEALACGAFGSQLHPAERVALTELLEAWDQRALGQVSLRDALLVDPRRGEQVYRLICAAQLAGRAALPADVVLPPGAQHCDQLLARNIDPEGLVSRAAREHLSLCLQCDPLDFPFVVEELEKLLPVPPPPAAPLEEPFEPPGEMRRHAAMLLASAGALSLALPLLAGHIPDQPAGMPLALLTLALLVGIRAGWTGYAGAFLLWLVANLPGFHHGSLGQLWPAAPLLPIGLLLLAADRRVRAMWRWLRRRNGIN